MKPIFKQGPILSELMDLQLAADAEGMELEAIELTVKEARTLRDEMNETCREMQMMGLLPVLTYRDINGMTFNGVELRVEDN